MDTQKSSRPAPTLEKKNNPSSSLKLKVTEAESKDVGRGIARVDPKDMEVLGLNVGDIVELLGKRKTVARIMPTYAQYRGKRIIQMDGLIRENAKLGLDEFVVAKKVDVVLPAEKLTLSPLSLMHGMNRGGDRYLGSLLEGIPLVDGDRIRASLFGTRTIDFQVVSTSPKGVITIAKTTTIELKTPDLAVAKKGVKISYEDIGGLGSQLERIREMIELPLKYPEIFERLGIDAPKGVFLYGPPGTGKTMIARAVANETDAYFTHISGPEIMGKFYGESESRLRAVFEDAQTHAPAIIFLDEIESIAPKREEMGGEKQVERRVVAQLLALMDGLEPRGQVIVIAATNLPNLVDPALRRPGRFDRELSIPIPDRVARREILEIHTRAMPLAKDVDLDKLAAITHGFVGADLAALAREAAMCTLRRFLPEVDFDQMEIPYEKLMKLEVGQNAFLEALKEVEPSAIREVFIETPDVSWDDVGGLDEVKKTLKEAIEWPLQHEELFRHAKAKPPKGILLYGPPGAGKTMLAKALAHESEVNFISIKGPELFSRFVGESERAVREIFKKAKQAAPTIIFIDEIDALVSLRGSGDASGVTQRVISQFLAEMDGIEELKGVIVIAATNRKELVDPALLRPGRFSLIVDIPKPNKKERLEIFKIHTKNKPLAKDVDLAEIAEEGGDPTGAEIEEICRQATMLAIREFLESKKKPMSEFFIRRKHFEMSLRMVAKQS